MALTYTQACDALEHAEECASIAARAHRMACAAFQRSKSAKRQAEFEAAATAFRAANAAAQEANQVMLRAYRAEKAQARAAKVALEPVQLSLF